MFSLLQIVLKFNPSSMPRLSTYNNSFSIGTHELMNSKPFADIVHAYDVHEQLELITISTTVPCAWKKASFVSSKHQWSTGGLTGFKNNIRLAAHIHKCPHDTVLHPDVHKSMPICTAYIYW